MVYSINWSELNCSVVAEGINGIEGIAAIKENSPDIVIVDINMPIMDGLEMIMHTYEKYDYSSIILSGYSNFEYAQRAIQYGVLGYLLKPLNRSELKEAILRSQKECEIRRGFKDNLRSKQEWKHINLFKDKGRKDNEDVIVKAMIEFIHINYQNRVVMQDVVNKLNYSETYLNNKFKKVVGTTFIEYLNRYRIQQALDLLRKGKYSIQDIAWKCGIGEYKYFSTVFKKYIGCSPKTYMKKISD
jgi:two-component system response regulator YesN